MKKLFEARGYNDPEGWPIIPETYRIGTFVHEEDAVKAVKGMGGLRHGDGKVEPIQVYESFVEFAKERDRKQIEDELEWQKRIAARRRLAY